MSHVKKSSYVRSSPWGSDVKKDSRQATIINSYREFFGTSIPLNKQYWTMCGSYFDEDENLVEGEMNQLFENEIIDPQQFHGVDIEAEIIKKNKKLFPEINWFNGDFLETMKEVCLDGNFKPGIIHYDGVYQPRFGMEYIKRILRFLDYNYLDEVLLITNMVLSNPYNNISYTMFESLMFLFSIYNLPDHWSVKPQVYMYPGSSRSSHCVLGIMNFIKKPHDVNNITFTTGREIGV